MIRYAGLVLTIVELVLLSLLAMRQADAGTVRDDVLRDSCDCIDDNFFYDESGRLVFEQHIFIDFNWSTGEEEIVDWRLVKSESQAISRDRTTGGYVARWLDNDKWREVRSSTMRTTWLQFDYEVAAREKMPKEQRRGLRKWRGF